MPFLPVVYNLVSRFFKYGPVKKIKAALRPTKHYLFGKNGIYEVVDIVKNRKGGCENVRVVFDVGAAVGDTAATFLKNFPRAIVYCFEPLPESFATLRKSVAGFGERARCFNFALSDKDGNVEFYKQFNHDASSFVALPTDGAGTAIKVRTRRLDDVVKELGIAKIDFMKVDVQGWEKEVIEGGRATFGEKVENLFIEIVPLYYSGWREHFYIDVLEELYGAGFSWVGVFGDFFFTKK
jgi:FkbM family methyltransferase